jgi:hypothetical protein
MKKIVFAFSLVLALEIVTFSSIYAKRLLPFLQSTPKAVSVKSTSRGVTASVKFRGDRLAIITTFGNLKIARKVDYFLSYATRGTTQGVSGTINSSSSDPTTREMIFGSCSHGVCRFDTGITNARFVVTTYLTSGQKVIKSFKLKV